MTIFAEQKSLFVTYVLLCTYVHMYILLHMYCLMVSLACSAPHSGNKQGISVPSVDVMITIFIDFRWKKWLFFSQTNVVSNFFHNLTCFESKTLFFVIFGKTIFKIIPSVPGHNLPWSRCFQRFFQSFLFLARAKKIASFLSWWRGLQSLVATWRQSKQAKDVWLFLTLNKRNWLPP
jgi:hypothetical protein